MEEMAETQYLSIFMAKHNCTFVSADTGSIFLKRGNILLARSGIRYNCRQLADASILHYQRQSFDNLFFTQIADCRILYDFLQSSDDSHEYLMFRTPAHTFTEELTAQMIANESMQDSYSDKLRKLLLVALFTYLDRSRPDTLSLTESTMVSMHRFGRVLKYMGDHYASCTLKDTAIATGYNPDYLSWRFRRITGVTFQEKLLDMRLSKAAELLVSTNITAEAIIQQVGLHNKSYFYRCFIDKYGCTPAVYRKKKTD